MPENNLGDMKKEHECWLDLYVRALDEADWEAFEEALGKALRSAELERLMLEINRAYEEESGLSSFSSVARAERSSDGPISSGEKF